MSRTISSAEYEPVPLPEKLRRDNDTKKDAVLFSEEDLKAGQAEIAKNKAIEKARKEEERMRVFLRDVGLNTKDKDKDIIGLTGSPEEQATLEKMKESMRPHFTVEQVLQAAQKGSLSYEISPKNVADEDIIKQAWLEAEKRIQTETENTKFFGKLKRFMGITGETKMEKTYNELTDFMRSMNISTGHIEATTDAITSSKNRADQGSGGTNYYERKENK